MGCCRLDGFCGVIVDFIGPSDAFEYDLGCVDDREFTNTVISGPQTCSTLIDGGADDGAYLDSGVDAGGDSGVSGVDGSDAESGCATDGATD